MKCSICKGEKQVPYRDAKGNIIQMDCATCNGQGTIPDNPEDQTYLQRAILNIKIEKKNYDTL